LPLPYLHSTKLRWDAWVEKIVTKSRKDMPWLSRLVADS